MLILNNNIIENNIKIKDKQKDLTNKNSNKDIKNLIKFNTEDTKIKDVKNNLININLKANNFKKFNSNKHNTYLSKKINNNKLHFFKANSKINILNKNNLKYLNKYGYIEEYNKNVTITRYYCKSFANKFKLRKINIGYFFFKKKIKNKGGVLIQKKFNNRNKKYWNKNKKLLERATKIKVINAYARQKWKFIELENTQYIIGPKTNGRIIYFFYKLINNLIINGKKDKAFDILYNVIFELAFEFRQKDPFLIIDKAIRCSIIVLKIKKKRIAGRVHHVPLFLKRVNQVNYSLKTFIDCIRLRSEKTMILKLLTEIKAINAKDYNAVVWKKKKMLYTQALANKFYVKYL